MRRRGFSLVGILAFAGLFLTFTLATLGLVDDARARLHADAERQQARILALSGVDYARARLTGGGTFRSPEIDGGWFEVRVSGRTARAVGHCGRAAESAERSLP
jgi:hypothetical protein